MAMTDPGLLTVAAADGRGLLAAAPPDWSNPAPDSPRRPPPGQAVHARSLTAPAGMRPPWSGTWARSWGGWPGSSTPAADKRRHVVVPSHRPRGRPARW